MAKQDAHPNSWFETDGCSGVLDFTDAITRCCDIHDTDYHWGGDAKAKAKADTAFYKNLDDTGWLGHLLAPGRYRGVRRMTWNHPPAKGSLGGPAERRYDTMFQALRHGQTRIEAWNWAGPGRGEHAGMEAQDHLLPEQSSVVAASREVA